MTYCVGVLVDEGLILASDSRTHAEVDNFAKFCKMTVFERPGDRVIVLLSSGNLAGTQAVISLLKQRADVGGEALNLWNARTMFDVANLVADAMRDIERRDGEYLAEGAIEFNASFILGGQIKGEPMRLFRIYAEGNFIEAGLDTPFLQTGETKYGKPIIDRVITRDTSLADRSHLLRTGQPRSADAPTLRRRRCLLRRVESAVERRGATGLQSVARAAVASRLNGPSVVSREQGASMQIRLGYELIYECPQPTPMLLTLNIHFSRVSDIVVPDHLITSPSTPVSAYRDGFGNWCTRIVAPKGEIRLSADAIVNDTGEPDRVVPSAHRPCVDRSGSGCGRRPDQPYVRPQYAEELQGLDGGGQRHRQVTGHGTAVTLLIVVRSRTDALRPARPLATLRQVASPMRQRPSERRSDPA